MLKQTKPQRKQCNKVCHTETPRRRLTIPVTMPVSFEKSFTQQEPIPEPAIAKAVEVMRSGKLHRYNTEPGELSEAAALEKEFAAMLGVEFCLACASGGYAIHIALKACGLNPGDIVMTNAFTLAPVPGAIDNAGGKAALIEIDENYCVDLTHLETVMRTSKSKFFLMSHMRGHLADMDAVIALCNKYNVCLIEDCAHTMGAYWNGKPSGTFGKAACFSTQTYKHINSGEGGFLTTNDNEVMARAIIHSGSYMLFDRHGTAPDKDVFDQIKLETPNYSGRMDNLRAAILREQLGSLEDNCKRWNKLYKAAEAGLRKNNSITLSDRPTEETYVGSSIQFRVQTLEDVNDFIDRCARRGVELKWFGNKEPHGFTSRYDSWQYLGDTPTLPNTLRILDRTFDMRLPLTFDVGDMVVITDIINEEVASSL